MSMVSETRPCIDMKTLEKTQSQRRIHSATYSVSVTSDSPDQTTAQRKSQPIMHLGTSDLSGRTSRTSCENLYDYLDHSSEYETRSAENSFSMTDSDFNLERYLVQSWPQASQLSCEDTSISSLSNHQQSDALVEPSLPSYSYGPFWSSAFTNSRVHARCGSDFPHNTGAAFCDPSAIMVETHHVSSAENGLYDIEPSYLITSHHGDTLDSDTCASHKVAHEDDSIASFSTEAASSPPVKSEDLNPSPKYSEIDAQSDNVDFDEFIKTSSCEPERPKRAAGKARCFCEFCGKPFARTFNYHTHLQTHDPARPRPYQCAYTTCSKSFFRPTDLKRHDQSVHLKSKAFACEQCGAGFPRKDSLQRHIKDGCVRRTKIRRRKDSKQRKELNSIIRDQPSARQAGNDHVEISRRSTSETLDPTWHGEVWT